MNVIITGATGMVGKGVLIECLERADVDSVLVINRSHLEMEHPKLQELLLADFTQIATLKEHLAGYDACFFCMGVSSVGMSEEKFTQLTYDIAKAFVDVLYEVNPEMVFNYVSGTGTDSTEKGRVMWARVKGRTENMILNKGFKDAYAFRPGVILPEKGVKSKTALYNFFYVILKPFFPLMRNMKMVTTSEKVGKAMINSVLFPQENKFLENKDINELSLMG